MIAVAACFRRELVAMLRDLPGAMVSGQGGRDAVLVWWLIIGTIPACVFGLLIKDAAEEHAPDAATE